MENAMLQYASYISQCREKADAVKKDMEMEQLAYFDALTGMKNRACFEKDCEPILTQSTSIVFIDANELKLFNDKYGHAAGDELLKKLADTIQKIWSADRAYRVGGDEFWIISTVPEEQIEEEVRQFREVLSKATLYGSRITAAVGVAHGDTGDSIEDVISLADQEMYKDKRAMKKGRGNIVPTVGTTERSEVKETQTRLQLWSDFIKSGLVLLALVLLFICIN